MVGRNGQKDAIKVVRRWLIVLVITLALFYAMDHALMGVQGLPLDWNLSPRN